MHMNSLLVFNVTGLKNVKLRKQMILAPPVMAAARVASYREVIESSN